jgi:type IV pilus assembly protein PilM
MIWIPFQRKAKKFLGIDIGSLSVKVVELSKSGDKIRLENYGFSTTKSFLKKSFPQGTFLFSPEEISQILKSILKEARIKTTLANFALPDLSSFFTTIELPPMTKEEIPKAVSFEARKYIPLPLDEVVLDWSIIEKKAIREDGEEKMKILLVAIPKEIIQKYQKIAQLSGLKVQSLETEAFALKRALVKEKEKGVICLVDIGIQSTSFSLIEDGILKGSHSFELSSGQLTQLLVQSFNLSWEEAEILKKKRGLKSRDLAEILIPPIDLILEEIERIVKNYLRPGGQEPKVYILAGGTALLPGLKEHFELRLKKEIKIADPFEEISYPAPLEPILKQMGPSFAVAIGSALHGL